MLLECSYDDYKPVSEDIEFIDSFQLENENVTVLNSTLIDLPIQIKLAEHYSFYKLFGLKNYMCFIYILKCEEEQKLPILKKLFSSIFICNNKTEYTPIQLSNISETGIKTFDKLLKENKIHDMVKYFLLKKPYVNDIKKNKIYVFEKEKHIKKDIINDEYINYLFKVSKISAHSDLNVSGFSVDELSNDVYLKKITSRFNKVFLFASPTKINNKTYYIKTLKFT